MELQKNVPKNKMSWKEAILHKENILRDIIISAVAVAFFIILIENHRQRETENNMAVSTPAPIIEKTAEEAIGNEAESPVIDTASWPIFETQWYGFEMKYPEDWNKPILESAGRGDNWEYRYQFRKKESENGSPYVGFNVVIYNVAKVKELSNTDEFQVIKNGILKEPGVCQEIGEHIAENKNYSAEQVYIGQYDECYYPAYFYTLTRDNYIYNIVPIVSDEMEKTAQSEDEIIENFPEFIPASSTFNLTEIKRSKPIPAKPKITAPKPVGATKRDSQGRRVCAKKNDDPGKSNQGKKKHLDMECCLDPDEYPNPHCYYPPSKYGKYL